MKPPEDIPSSGPCDARSSRGDEAGSESDRRLTATATPAAGPPPAEPPDLPGFRTWRGVYMVVLGIYALWIALLALLTEKFS
jgi:hypothetical protein